MKSIWVGIQVAFSALGGFLGWYLGGMDGFLYALIAFVLVDYITGVMCAIVDKKLSSAVGFKGICRKVLIFVLVGIGNLVDVYVLGQEGVLRTAVIFFYLSRERWPPTRPCRGIIGGGTPAVPPMTPTSPSRSARMTSRTPIIWTRSIMKRWTSACISADSMA